MKKILFVDDETYRVGTIIALFKEKGFEILHKESKNEAINALKNENFDAIILDIMMPTDDPAVDEMGLLTGINLGIFVRKSMGIKTPIIFYSARNDESIFNEMKKLEKVYFIPKPYSALRLIEKIGNIIDS